MNFTISRSSVLPVFNQALKTYDKDSVFIFEYKDKALCLKSLDKNCEQHLTLETISITADEGESFTIAGPPLVDFFRQFPDDEVKGVYNSDKSTLIVGSNTRQSRFAFPTGKAKNIMQFKVGAPTGNITCRGSVLAKAFHQTAFSASTDPAFAPLTSVKLVINEDKLSAQSSDNHRITVFDTTIVDTGAKAELLIPKETAETLAGLLQKIGDVEITCYSKYVKLCWTNTIFISRLENGIGKPFPDVSKYLKGNEQSTLTISREDLLRSLKLASLISKDSYLNLETNDDGLIISTDEKSKGASRDLVIAQDVDGTSESAVSCKYFMRAIEMTTAPWIIIIFNELPTLNTNGSAVVVKDGEYQHLVFPVVPNDSGDDDDDDTTSSNDDDDEPPFDVDEDEDVPPPTPSKRKIEVEEDDEDDEF